MPHSTNSYTLYQRALLLLCLEALEVGSRPFYRRIAGNYEFLKPRMHVQGLWRWVAIIYRVKFELILWRGQICVRIIKGINNCR